MIQLQRQTTSDRDMEALQSNVDQALRSLQKNPLVDGNLLTSISLTSGQDNQVAHKLQRLPQVWILTDQQNNAVVYRSAWDDTYLTLQCSANCTVSLWVG